MRILRWEYIAIILGLAAAAIFVEYNRQALAETHHDAAAGVLSLAVGIVGFAVAIAQLASVQKSSVAAQEAVSGMATRIHFLEDVIVCDNVLKTTAEIERMHLVAIVNTDFASHLYLPERYRFLRGQLLELRARLWDRLSREQRVAIQSAITKLESFERAVAKGLKRNAYPRLQPLDTALAQVTQEVVAIFVAVKKEAVSTNVS